MVEAKLTVSGRYDDDDLDEDGVKLHIENYATSFLTA